HNTGNGHFSDVIATSGITVNGGAAVAVADYNNDGLFDVFVAASAGNESTLWLNNGNGTFRRDTRSADVVQRLRGTSPNDATFVDFDNDGWLDLMVVGTPA